MLKWEENVKYGENINFELCSICKYRMINPVALCFLVREGNICHFKWDGHTVRNFNSKLSRDLRIRWKKLEKEEHKAKKIKESKTELFWCMVGDYVQTHFLYHTILTKEQFENLTKKVHDEVDG